MEKRLTHKLIPNKECKREKEVDKELSKTFTTLTSSLYVLAVKLKGFHWNIIGNQFFPIHIQLDCQVDDLLDFADGAAELIRQIDKSPAPVNMRSMVVGSRIKETLKSELITAESMLPIIIHDYCSMIDFCKEIVKQSDAADRQDLSDFTIGVQQYLSKYKWQFDSARK